MNDSEAKNPPSPVDHPASSQPSRALCLQLQSLETTVQRLRGLSMSWGAMNAGELSSGWRTRWKAAQSSLETLRELSVPSPSLAVSG